MSTFKIRAIVLKDKDMGESNKMLTVFAKDMGKLNISARGAKNSKSKYLQGAHSFCYCDFVLYEGNDFLAVTQIDLIKNFAVYYHDIFKLTYAAYFLELLDKSIMFSQEANNILLLLLKGLSIMERTAEPKKISAVFQIKLLQMLGFSPAIYTCEKCGSATKDYDLFYDELGRFTCGNCSNNSSFPVAKSVQEAIAYILNQQDLQKIFMFRLHNAAINELLLIAETTTRARLDFVSNSLELIKNF